MIKIKLSLLTIGVITASGFAFQLNDDGNTTFADSSKFDLLAEPANYPGQSATYGRDAAAVEGKLSKIGGGMAGLDYTKIANDGSELPMTAVLGAGAKDWACTRDNVTGLMWEVKTMDMGLRDKNWTYSWFNSDSTQNGGAEATPSLGSCKTSGRCDTEKYIQDVNKQGLCGQYTWRLPKLEELRSLILLGPLHAKAPYDTIYFPNTKLGHYWSADIDDRFSGAWYIDFQYGTDYNYNTDQTNYVRLVFSPPASETVGKPSCRNFNHKIPIPTTTTTSNFVDNGDGTVLHKSTGLIWKRCAEGDTWNGVTCSYGRSGNLNWPEALAAAQNSTFAGFSDWRLPNLNELSSIVDLECYGPAINVEIFPNTISTDFWTSSLDDWNDYAYKVWFYGGGSSVDSRTADSNYVRLVRGGLGHSSFDRRTGTVPVLQPHPELRPFSGITRILSANGRLIWQGQVKEGDLGRMMGSYAPGIYFVEGSMGSQRVVQP